MIASASLCERIAITLKGQFSVYKYHDFFSLFHQLAAESTLDQNFQFFKAPKTIQAKVILLLFYG